MKSSANSAYTLEINSEAIANKIGVGQNVKLALNLLPKDKEKCAYVPWDIEISPKQKEAWEVKVFIGPVSAPPVILNVTLVDSEFEKVDWPCSKCANIDHLFKVCFFYHFIFLCISTRGGFLFVFKNCTLIRLNIFVAKL